jgi:hypothetical protein
MLSNIFFFINDRVEKSPKKIENEWRRDENSLCDDEIHGIILHPATSSVPSFSLKLINFAHFITLNKFYFIKFWHYYHKFQISQLL